MNRKYGSDHVAQIVTFGTMAAKGAIRDVGRALDVPYADVDAIAKQVPNSLHMTLNTALPLSKPLRIPTSPWRKMTRPWSPSTP